MPDRPTIVAVVDDSTDADPVVQRAIDLGLERGARVVLYDVTAAASFLESPLPTAFASEGPDREPVPSLLDPGDLEAAGQAPLAGRVRALREAGIDAYGWLPDSDDADDVVEYAREHGADLVIASEALDPSPDDLTDAGLERVERVR